MSLGSTTNIVGGPSESGCYATVAPGQPRAGTSGALHVTRPSGILRNMGNGPSTFGNPDTTGLILSHTAHMPPFSVGRPNNTAGRSSLSFSPHWYSIKPGQTSLSEISK